VRRGRVDVSLLTTGHDVADARLHRLAAIMLGQGLTVEVHGLGTAGGGPPGTTVRARPRGGLLHRAVRALLLPWAATGRVVVVLDPELVAPAVLHRVLARHRGSAGRLVVDVHEDYRKTLADRSWARGLRLTVARAVVATATWAATLADLTLVADDHLPPGRPRSRLVVRNIPLREMLPPPTVPETRPRALYVGDVRRSRGLHAMLALLEACPDWSLDVVGPVAAADRQWLAEWRATSLARDRVVFHGRKPPREAWRLASGAWVGLCLLEPTPAFVNALPTKVLDYLACGLGVVTSPLPRSAALVRESGAGAVAADVEAAASTLRRWAQAPDDLRARQAAARSWSAVNLDPDDHYGEFGERMTRLVRDRGDLTTDDPVRVEPRGVPWRF